MYAIRSYYVEADPKPGFLQNTGQPGADRPLAVGAGNVNHRVTSFGPSETLQQSPDVVQAQFDAEFLEA